MKRIWIIATVAVIITLIVIAVYLNTKNNQTTTSSNTTTSNNSSNSTDQTSTAPNAIIAGSYVDYRDGIIEETSGTKVLFFHAPWCPQCKALDASIKAGKIPDNVTIIKVDYDSSSELKKKYGVTLQTTLVRVDDEGKLIKKYVAYSTPSLDALISNVL